MDTNRLNQGEMIAAVSAAVLLLIMFAFSWFGLGGDLADQASDAGFDTGANAWESFSIIDIVLLITILVAVGGAVMTANAQNVDTPVAISAITAALGIISVLLILFRLISPPDLINSVFDEAEGADVDISRKIGAFLGLIAAAGIAYGGWRAMQTEGTSFSGEADRMGDRRPSDPGPPPPPPPSSGGTPPPAPGPRV